MVHHCQVPSAEEAACLRYQLGELLLVDDFSQAKWMGGETVMLAISLGEGHMHGSVL